MNFNKIAYVTETFYLCNNPKKTALNVWWLTDASTASLTHTRNIFDLQKWSPLTNQNLINNKLS